ncbi:twitching motility protein PilT [Sulfolobus acidocaldarius SUSAZ]|nr:twitching motility protein PilT [Sulfolobus acidocaldarius SUSAZ]
MRYYIDTSALIALVNEKDPNHELSLMVIPKEGERIISDIVELELYSAFSRTLKLSEEELDALVNYTVLKGNCKKEELDFNKLFETAKSLANITKLKSLDLLHLSASILLNCELITLDKELENARDKISSYLP